MSDTQNDNCAVVSTSPGTVILEREREPDKKVHQSPPELKRERERKLLDAQDFSSVWQMMSVQSKYKICNNAPTHSHFFY